MEEWLHDGDDGAVVGMDGVRVKGEGAEVEEEVAERNADSGKCSRKLLWK